MTDARSRNRFKKLNSNGKVATETKRSSRVPNPQCLALLSDLSGRCPKPGIVGKAGEQRCRDHQAEYQATYKAYKEAGERVSTIKENALIPTFGEIERMYDHEDVLESFKRVDEYLEAMNVEWQGREAHSARFFLKVDEGHQTRTNNLAKEIKKTNRIWRKLQERAMNLSFAAAYNTNELEQSDPISRFNAPVEPELTYSEWRSSLDGGDGGILVGACGCEEQAIQTPLLCTPKRTAHKVLPSDSLTTNREPQTHPGHQPEWTHPTTERSWTYWPQHGEASNRPQDEADDRPQDGAEGNGSTTAVVLGVIVVAVGLLVKGWRLRNAFK